MQPSAILESALYVTDLAAAEAFYTHVLGMERILKAEGRYVFFRCGRGVLLLFSAEATRNQPPPIPQHGTTGQGHLCFAATAEEIERWKARLGAEGIVIEAEVEWPKGGRSIYFRDPSGNSLEFAESKIWNL